jgi:hypothetical protein
VLPFNFELLPTKKLSTLPLFFAFFVFDLKVQKSLLKFKVVARGCFDLCQRPILNFYLFYILCLKKFVQLLQSMDEKENTAFLIMGCILFHLVDETFNSPLQSFFLNMSPYFVNPNVA